MGCLLALPVLGFSQASRFIVESRPLPKGRGFHGSAVMGDFLYVFGGTSTTRPTVVGGEESLEEVDLSVIKARILPGGALEDWTETTPLPKALHYIGASTISLNDVVYIIGGSSLAANGVYSDTAIWSKPLPDGTLMPWRESRPFGEKLSIMTAITTPGHIHVIGGLVDAVGTQAGGRLPTSKVYTNNVSADGTMGAWVEGPQLPAGIWYHSAGVAAGRVYVWGGVLSTSANLKTTSSNVLSAPILGTGKLGPWQVENNFLSTPMYSASSAVAGPYLISFCPRYPNPDEKQINLTSSDVWWSYVTPLGLIPWTREETSIPNKVYHSITPDYRRGGIYLIGGRPSLGEDFTNKVWYFTLSAQARTMAENQWSAAQRAHAGSVSTYDTLAQSSADTGGQQGANQLSYLADKRLAEGAVAGFQKVDDARRVSGSKNVPLVMYFNSEGAKPCEDQKVILNTPEFAALSDKGAFAWINTREYPQLAQQLGVYRVPTWVFFDRQGNEVKRVANVIPMAELTSTVGGL